MAETQSGKRMGRPRKENKLAQSNLKISENLLKDFQKAIPLASERNRIIEKFIRSYLISGDSDRLLSQSPLAVKILNFLETLEDPFAEELAEEIHSLFVSCSSIEENVDLWVV